MRLKVRKGGRRPRIEVRSNVDQGWYDGSISLVHGGRKTDPEKLRVRVHFTDFENSEDEIWGWEILRSEDEIRKRVRMLSHQLQDNECDKVYPGRVVCASYTSADGVECKYYDAVVTTVKKAPHGRHYGEETCYCSFTVRWQEGPAGGTWTTLNCPDISLIVERDVGKHPLVRNLLAFARDYSVVRPVVPELAEPEGITPESQVSPEKASKLEHGFSPEEEPQEMDMELSCQEAMEMEDQESFQVQIPSKEELLEIKREHGLDDEILQGEEHLASNGEEHLEVKREQGLDDEIEQVEVQNIVNMECAAAVNEEREGLREEERNLRVDSVNEEKESMSEKERNLGVDSVNEERLREKEQNLEVEDIEGDWDVELEVMKVMEDLGLHYRPSQDLLLDLPPEVKDKLRSYELVQEALAKERLEIEKIVRQWKSNRG